ncbi:26878_t:CDS:2 [Dentiscutata erythropus]|uniref:non-specific serine/threonine protein kinase n=1 Tax=Dentiscutata erythropus TaxID=1348616 RepID=A0A9N9D437_9GLOM|nr:26878_t:CDS:2 [Dentiscutata erythropus]
MRTKRQKLSKPVNNYLKQEHIEYRRRINAPPPKSTEPIATFRIDCDPIVSFSLSEEKTSVCVGTLPGCNEGRIFVGEDYMIGKIHCQFVIVKRDPVVEGCNYITYVRDLSFNSSTFVNDKRIGLGNSKPLSRKDVIRIGELPNKFISIKYTDSEYLNVQEKINQKYKIPESIYQVRSVEDSLGKGAHGIVLKGLNTTNNEDVACKYMFRESTRSELYDRISEEVTILGKLEHKNIVKFYDFFKGPEHTIIVLELLDGGSLSSLINKQQIKFDVWTDFAHQICDAIQYMHDNGYMHRDIKASNIMLDKSHKTVKLIDFGLAKSFIKAEHSRDPIEHTLIGSPAYMAYEIAKELVDGKRECHFTCAVDMWSFGILNYHALTGSLPFMDENDPDDLILGRIISDDLNYSRLRELNLQCAVEFISGLCCKDPNSRLTAKQAMNHVFFQSLKNNDKRQGTLS